MLTFMTLLSLAHSPVADIDCNPGLNVEMTLQEEGSEYPNLTLTHYSQDSRVTPGRIEIKAIAHSDAAFNLLFVEGQGDNRTILTRLPSESDEVCLGAGQCIPGNHIVSVYFDESSAYVSRVSALVLRFDGGEEWIIDSSLRRHLNVMHNTCN